MLKEGEMIYNVVLHIVTKMYGNDLTSIDDIYHMLKRFNLRITKDSGEFERSVYVCDYSDGMKWLENDFKADASCIMNTMNAPGEHWVVCLYIKEIDQFIFYDSFGREFCKLMNRCDLKLIHTERDAEQGEKEMNCGQRCVVFIIVSVFFGTGYLLDI